MDGAHRSRRAAADDAAAARRAGVRGAAQAHARDGGRARARPRARARGGARRRAARIGAAGGARAQESAHADSLRRRAAAARRRRPELAETVEVLDDRIAAPRGDGAQLRAVRPTARRTARRVDVGELARYTARATIPPEISLTVDVADDVPMIHGHHDALARALSNVMLNAVDACRRAPTGRGADHGARAAVRVECEPRQRAPRWKWRRSESRSLSPTRGCGIPTEQLARIWDPYVTSKPGGTGLGLAIARQTVLAHDGSVGARESTPAWERRFDSCCRSTSSRNGESDDAVVPMVLIPIALFIDASPSRRSECRSRARSRAASSASRCVRCVPPDVHGAARADGAGDRLDRGRGRADLRGPAIHDEAAGRAERESAAGAPSRDGRR